MKKIKELKVIVQEIKLFLGVDPRCKMRKKKISAHGDIILL